MPNPPNVRPVSEKAAASAAALSSPGAAPSAAAKGSGRREFISGAAAAAAGFALPTIIPASALGRDGAVAPSGRVALACIGVGGMGTGNLNSFLQDERVAVVGICDVDANHRKRGLDRAKLGADKGTGDFREIVAREDVDAAMVATPDHWHAVITSALARAGKDIYCEKPLAASLAEGRFVSDTVKREKRVLQCGTWRRSGVYTRMACELVRNRYLGELKTIEVGVPGEFAVRGGFSGQEAPTPVPGHLDWKMWQGPAPEADFTPARCHFNFRWVRDYAPGYITDWGAHFLDVAQWGNGSDDSGPVAVRAPEVGFRPSGLYDAPERFHLDYTYANGVRMTMFSTTDKDRWGVKFVGTEGWVFTENQRFETHPETLRRTRIKEGEIRLFESTNHHRNFIDAVLKRGRTAAPAETAHRAATACHLGTVAAALPGRTLQFDPAAEKFTGADADLANRLLQRELRGGWKLG